MNRQSRRALLRLLDSELVDGAAAFQCGLDGVVLDMSRVIPAFDESLYSIELLNSQGLEVRLDKHRIPIMCASCGDHRSVCSQRKEGRPFEPSCEWCVDDGTSPTTVTTFELMQRIAMR